MRKSVALPAFTALACCSIIAAPASAGVRELPIDQLQEAALLKAAGSGFCIKRTSHFIVAYNTEKGLVDEFTLRIESTYQAILRFCEIGGLPASRPTSRLEIIFFDQRREYDAYARRLSFPSGGTYGFYYQPKNRSAFFNVLNDPQMVKLRQETAAVRANLDDMVATLGNIKDSRAPLEVRFSDGRAKKLTRSQAQRELDSARSRLNAVELRRRNYSDRVNQTVIQHEVAHQVLFNCGVHARAALNPKWIVEGLACLFETPPGPGGSGISSTNQLRLRDFRERVAGPQSRRLTGADFVQAIGDGKFMEPATLISDPHAFDGRDEDGAVAYAMAWGLTYYLQRNRASDLAAYLKEVAQRPPGSRPSPDEELKLFEKHFGPLDKAFLTRWGDYILRLPVRNGP